MPPLFVFSFGPIPESPGAARALPNDLSPAGARPSGPAGPITNAADWAGSPFRYTVADRTALLDITNQHLSQAERLAEALGKRAEIVDGLSDRAGNALGVVDDFRNGKVLIPTGKEGYSASYDLIASGMTESLGKSGQYEAFKNAVLKSIPEDELAASVNKLKSIYGKQNPALIEREVVNEWVSNNLYNSSAIKRIASADPELASKVKEYFGGLKSKLGGMKEIEAQVGQAEGMWERVGRRNRKIPSEISGYDDIDSKHATLYLDKETPAVSVSNNQEYAVQYSRDKLLNDVNQESFSKNIKEILNKYNIDMDEFNKLRLSPVSELNPWQKLVLKRIRELVPKPDNATLISKVIKKIDIERYINEKWNTIKGYVGTCM